MTFFLDSLRELYIITSDTAFFWAPFIFGYAFWKIWVHYVQADFIKNIKWVMFEVRIPKEIYKPPQAMEMVLAALDQPSAGSKIEQYWKGRIPLWFSLEIVSIEGSLHFFIRTPVKFKDLIESRVYSQYSEAEISEAPDYTEFVSFGKDRKIKIFATDFVLTKADPFPIKTYIDYGLDKGFVDEKQRFDPMTPLLEFLGSVGPKEQVWVQILVKAAKKNTYKKEDGTYGDWRDEARELIKKMTVGEQKEAEEGKLPPLFRLTKTQNENIADIERNMAKTGLDCGVRVLYLAEKDRFNPGQISSMMGAFKQFNSEELNGFKPARTTSLDYPWDKIDESMNDFRVGKMRRKMFNSYRLRSYFYPPYERKPFILTTEELATIFRFPSAIAETPTLKRIESKKSEPPANLPI